MPEEQQAEGLARLNATLEHFKVMTADEYWRALDNAKSAARRKKEEAADAVAYVTECMKWRPKWAQTLPLTCEVGFAENYGEA